MMRPIIQDVRYALRHLRRSPGFAFTVVAVLALGIGANFAVFTLLNGILLRPLPYAHPDRIVSIELAGPVPYYTFTYANMLQLRDAVGPQLKIGAESVGLACGAALAWFCTTFARSYIYGVQAHDGLTFAAVILVLAAASFLAAWLPARRAASVDPILALRSE